MAFESLTDKLQNVFKGLKGKGRLSEEDVKLALKEVKMALLEADVSFKVVKQFNLPGGSSTVVVQALGRFHLKRLTKLMPYLDGEVEPKPEMHPDKHDKEWKTAIDDLRNMAERYISMVDEMPDEAMFAIRNIHNDEMMLSFLCSNMPFTIQEKVKLLTVETVKERLFGAMKPVRISTSNRRTTSCNSKSRTCRLKWVTSSHPRNQSCFAKPWTRNGRTMLHALSIRK